MSQVRDSSLQELEEYVNQGRFRKAIQNFRQNKLESPKSFSLVGSAYAAINQEDSAIHYFKLAKSKYLLLGEKYRVAEINYELADLIESQDNLEYDTYYFDEFWDYAKETKDTFLLGLGNNFLGRLNFLNKEPEIPLLYFKKASELFLAVGRTRLSILNKMNVGAVFSNRIKNQDSAQFYYENAIRAIDMKDGQPIYMNLYHDLLNNMGNSHRRAKNYNTALFYYKQAETLNVKKYHLKTKKILYGNMETTYFYLNDYENAYDYLYKYDSIKDIIDISAQNSTISDIEEKYNNEKLRADNLEIEQKRIKNRNWLIAASLALVFGAGIALLLQKNTTKKRQLAEQEAVLKQQRVENLLKEQELVSIDAMIAGQEKERQKVAGELHDDLGSLMATIKLHFDNAKISNQDPALKNAQKLLEEAYQKIRGMAHSKNSGVMSDQGLLAAIKKMAKTITETNALEVTVEDFGLGERLENSLELSIFRMVQELLANAIKHANATKLSIQLTQHEDNLNIIVEDNGKGFERSKLDKGKSGMGLTNIEKRVEHLEGSFTVDSIVGKGTSILIDIPV